MKITEKHRTILEDLLKQGAMLSLLSFELDALGLAHAEFLEDEKGPFLKWCALFPQHQGHIHRLRFDKVEIEDGRLVFLDGKGESIAFILEYIPEFELMGETSFSENWRKWNALLERRDNQERFMDFFTYA